MLVWSVMLTGWYHCYIAMQKQHGDKAGLIIGGKFHVLLGHYLVSNSNQQ